MACTYSSRSGFTSLSTSISPGETARGVTVTPTTARAGDTANTVPAHAELGVDVRVPTAADQRAVDSAVRALAGTDSAGVTVEVDGGPNRPPLEPSAAETLLARARSAARRLGIQPPQSAAVGGVSDGNITASLGTPTLDGLGAVGGDAHAEHEYIDVQPTIDRIGLIAGLICELAARPVDTEPSRCLDMPRTSLTRRRDR